MKRLIYILSLFVIILTTFGCSSFDDMNRNPYAIYDAPAESYVQSILYKTESTILKKSYDLIPNLMQYAVSTNYYNTAMIPYNYVIDETNASTLWGLYAQKGNAESMLTAALEGNNPAMEGVALILRTFIMHVITDTYGDVPYFKAGLIPQQGNQFEYTVPYDSQKEIYIDMFKSLERANNAFIEADAMVAAGELSTADFKAACDYTYGGKVEKWRRFGNSLYLRLLMRVSLKVKEEDGGSLDLGEEYGKLDIVSKIAQIYDGFVSESGDYPIISSVEDRAKAKFSKMDSYLYTPFYTTTSGIWKGQAACATLVDKMVIKNDKNKETLRDPRFNYYFTRPLGAPSQLANEDMQAFFETNVTSLGNSAVGRFVNGGDYGDLQNAEWYPLLNYSEILFLFAEAGCRGWISASDKEVKGLYLQACEASMKEWNPFDIVPPSPGTTPDAFLSYLDEQFDYDNALEDIMWQKWVASFWLGIESWADYRRTGYPVLKTNGPAAENKGILCTRMRYPATEAYHNKKYYEAAVLGWLGGDDNMTVDVWWADTQESINNRRKGRQ